MGTFKESGIWDLGKMIAWAKRNKASRLLSRRADVQSGFHR